MDVVINEIMYEPTEEQTEFIELRNVSEKWVDIATLAIQYSDGEDLSESVDTMKISEIHRVMAPNSFAIIAPYGVQWLHELVEPLPVPVIHPEKWQALVNEGRYLSLFCNVGGTLDDVHYSPGQHSPFLASTKGVSLERISAAVQGLESSNWASAAANNGFATPGLPNSQTANGVEGLDGFCIQQKVVTPDVDGHDDYLSIGYTFQNAGVVASAWIFDMHGNLLKEVCNNLLLGLQGKLFWDGKDSNGNNVPSGYYIVLAEAFHSGGMQIKFKESFIVAYP